MLIALECSISSIEIVPIVSAVLDTTFFNKQFVDKQFENCFYI